MTTSNRPYSTTVNDLYVAAGLVLGAAGIALAVFGPSGEVSLTPVDGISMFAVLYLIAQAAERVTEFAVLALSWKLPSAEENKAVGLKEVRAAQTEIVSTIASSAEASTDTKEAAKERVGLARRALAVFAGGLGILLCAAMVRATDFLLLSTVGLTGVNERVDVVITTLAAAGGSKGLHETITRIQKSKEKSDET
jgi:hypothetical protein